MLGSEGEGRVLLAAWCFPCMDMNMDMDEYALSRDKKYDENGK